MAFMKFSERATTTTHIPKIENFAKSNGIPKPTYILGNNFTIDPKLTIVPHPER
jgi:hypothetical protein